MAALCLCLAENVLCCAAVRLYQPQNACLCTACQKPHRDLCCRRERQRHSRTGVAGIIPSKNRGGIVQGILIFAAAKVRIYRRKRRKTVQGVIVGKKDPVPVVCIKNHCFFGRTRGQQGNLVYQQIQLFICRCNDATGNQMPCQQVTLVVDLCNVLCNCRHLRRHLHNVRQSSCNVAQRIL